MLNFENPAPEEELDNNAPEEPHATAEQNPVEFPRSMHHAAPTQKEVEVPDGEEQKTESAESAKKAPGLRKLSLPRFEESPAKEPSMLSAVFHPGSRKNAGPSQPDRKLESSRLLAAARTASGLTPIEVEERTKVRACYVEALEKGEFDALPQQVYVLAYLRRLAEVYGIKGDDLVCLLEPWRDIPCEIPENLPARVSTDPDNPNRKTLHQLEIGLYIAGGVLVIGIVALLITLISSWLSGTRKAENPVFNHESLLALQPQQNLMTPKTQGSAGPQKSK